MTGELLPRDPLAGAAALVPRALRAWWVGLLALFTGLASTAIWVVSTNRMYRSEAVIVYERPIVASFGGVSAEGSSPRHVGIQLQDMVTSRQRLEKLIKEMKLYPSVVARRGLIEAIEEMRKGLGVGVREGFTFRVSYDSDSRDLAQQVLTRLVQSVVDDDTKRRARDAEQAKLFLDKERQHADDLLRDKEAALAGFLTRHPDLAVEGGINASPGGSIRAADRGRAAEGTGEIASLEMQAAQIEIQIAEAVREPGGGGPQELPPDPVLASAPPAAVSEVQAAERALLDKQARFTDEHPDVKLARWQLSQVQAKLKAADAALAAHRPVVKAVASTSGGENSAAANRSAALKRALAAVRSQIAAV